MCCCWTTSTTLIFLRIRRCGIVNTNHAENNSPIVCNTTYERTAMPDAYGIEFRLGTMLSVTTIMIEWRVSSPMNNFPERKRTVVESSSSSSRPDHPTNLQMDGHPPAIATRTLVLVLLTMRPMEERVPPPPPRPHYLGSRPSSSPHSSSSSA